MKSTNYKSFFKHYLLSCVLRVILVFIPQTGYIHPDEFFQSVEVLAGRTFEYEVNLPWEFNSTSPIRSIGVPYLTIGLSYKILDTINFLVKSFINVTIISPYLLLIIPRLFICILSFLIDYSLYKICLINNEKYKSRLIILSTSFVIIVFCTRTFTNTLEVILFSILIYYVSEAMIFSNIIVRQNEYLNKRYSKSKNPVDKVKFYKLKMFLASHSFRNCLEISTISVLGFFNRPTFVCFAVLPVFFWLYRGIGYKSVTAMQFHARAAVLLFFALPTIILLIVIDSFFYGYISWGEVGMFDLSINSFVFTPLNFIKYNIDKENLAQHGLHPRYLHLFVNIPLLFNVLGIFAILETGDIFYKLAKQQYQLLPTVRSIKGLMVASSIAPIALLSIFPHQESRFILPIIFPIVYLYASKVYSEPDHELANVSKGNLKKELLESKEPGKSKLYFKIWISFNLLFIIFFGFVHQGGVYTASSFLSSEIHSKPHYNYHIITSHIYSIPHMLFMQPDLEKLYYRKSSAYKKTKSVFTYEEGSRDLDKLLQKVLAISNIAENNKRRYKIFLVLTGSLDDNLRSLNYTASSKLDIMHYKRFYPHISTEAMPNFSELIDILISANVQQLSYSKISNCILALIQSFSLNIYEIKLM